MSGQTPRIAQTAMRTLMIRFVPAPPWLALAFIMAIGALWGTAAQAQQMQLPSTMQMPGMGTPSQIPPLTDPDLSGPGRVFQEQRIKALNNERQKELVSDTNKLLKLTAQLDAQVGNGRSDSFTLDQLRMLARIEKLAKSVKEKMSNPISMPTFQSNLPPIMAPATMP